MGNVTVVVLVNVTVDANDPLVVRLPARDSVELSVPARVIEALAVSVLPSATVRVEPVAGAVSATLLIDVAEATPRTGVTSVGLVENTRLVEVVPVAPAAV